jgi:hypothetical protein
MTDIKPTIPIMGALVQASRDKWNAWTGGKPKPSWVRLEDSTANYESPSQLCSKYPSSAQKGFNYLKKGLETKFSKKDDLALFQKQILKHLVDCGMDSSASLEDPADSLIMSNVIKEYTRFTLSIAQKAITHQSILYDKYDRENAVRAIHIITLNAATWLSYAINIFLLERHYIIVRLNTHLSVLVAKKIPNHRTNTSNVAPFLVSNDASTCSPNSASRWKPPIPTNICKRPFWHVSAA